MRWISLGVVGPARGRLARRFDSGSYPKAWRRLELFLIGKWHYNADWPTLFWDGFRGLG